MKYSRCGKIYPNVGKAVSSIKTVSGTANMFLWMRMTSRNALMFSRGILWNLRLNSASYEIRDTNRYYCCILSGIGSALLWCMPYEPASCLIGIGNHSNTTAEGYG